MAHDLGPLVRERRAGRRLDLRDALGRRRKRRRDLDEGRAGRGPVLGRFRIGRADPGRSGLREPRRRGQGQRLRGATARNRRECALGHRAGHRDRHRNRSPSAATAGRPGSRGVFRFLGLRGHRGSYGGCGGPTEPGPRTRPGDPPRRDPPRRRRGRGLLGRAAERGVQQRCDDADVRVQGRGRRR